jgi:hypothetical protein
MSFGICCCCSLCSLDFNKILGFQCVLDFLDVQDCLFSKISSLFFLNLILWISWFLDFIDFQDWGFSRSCFYGFQCFIDFHEFLDIPDFWNSLMFMILLEFVVNVLKILGNLFPSTREAGSPSDRN